MDFFVKMAEWRILLTDARGALEFIISAADTISAAHHVPFWVKTLPIVMSALGLFLGWLFYIKFVSLPKIVSTIFKPVHALFFNKWFFDELNNVLFLKPAYSFGRLFWKTDKHVVDGIGPDGVAKTSLGVAGLLSKFQSGYVFQYALVMMLGLIGLISWFFYKMTFTSQMLGG